MITTHEPECRWAKTKPEECEYRNTHHFCPHEEHRCDCAEKKLAAEHIHQFFAFQHLPPHLAEVSRPFAELATALILSLPRNPERTVALRKLLEAKDAAVRAKLAK